jgi:hypothetical protein
LSDLATAIEEMIADVRKMRSAIDDVESWLQDVTAPALMATIRSVRKRLSDLEHAGTSVIAARQARQWESGNPPDDGRP